MSADRPARISYVVRFEFSDRRVAEEWLAWERDKHMDELRAAGIEHQQIVRVEEPATTATVYDSRCEFSSRNAFEHYLAYDAARFREEAATLFGEERGVRTLWSVGTIVLAAQDLLPAGVA